ncbi:Rop family plasmid primer RNA-binding protein (plasmid) [Arsenophonus endosymbiont of Aphis craccivora]|uniref:Rop family plasmid primer RNA-binding protein n=1 Tax=Arsenophonus endosymbiont of Aphis craccivora TaxID=1231049 RepID=UPI0015DC7CD1|nr:Rop family plasmid primer RNA-binding protein [Arsenophonus endosymbiont of Aphis craccivora]QLK88766.1 Rop family plasmid primer RNA-binding protein [Arsenophonus endosymbiont of Aphis craccivora]
MNKQELSALNMAGFIKSQTLILFKLNQLNLYDCADECEDLHDMAEALYLNLKKTLER